MDDALEFSEALELSTCNGLDRVEGGPLALALAARRTFLAGFAEVPPAAKRTAMSNRVEVGTQAGREPRTVVVPCNPMLNADGH